MPCHCALLFIIVIIQKCTPQIQDDQVLLTFSNQNVRPYTDSMTLYTQMSVRVYITPCFHFLLLTFVFAYSPVRPPSRGGRAESREPRTESREPRAERREPRAKTVRDIGLTQQQIHQQRHRAWERTTTLSSSCPNWRKR